MLIRASHFASESHISREDATTSLLCAALENNERFLFTGGLKLNVSSSSSLP